MEPRVSVITLGTADIERARAFYEALGWTGTSPDGEVVFIQAGGLVLALWSRSLLAEDSGTTDSGGWGGVTLAHNVAFPAEVCPALAPASQGLVSVSTQGEHGLSEEELTARLRDELAGWFGPVANMWRHLRTYRIEQALPVYAPGQPVQQELRLTDTLYRCGDWVSYPSLNAALGTGRQVAEMLVG